MDDGSQNRGKMLNRLDVAYTHIYIQFYQLVFQTVLMKAREKIIAICVCDFRSLRTLWILCGSLSQCL